MKQWFSWQPFTFDLVHWELYGKRNTTLSLSKRIFALKWLHRILPFQECLHRFKSSPSAECPSACGAPTEDKTHFLTCKHPQQRSAWVEYANSLPKLFCTWCINPHLQTAWILLAAPYTGNDTTSINNLPPEYQMLITTQLEIRPWSIFDGLLSTEWVSRQHAYLSAEKLPHLRNQAFNGLKAISLHAFSHIHNLWLLCNSHLHHTNPQTNHCFARSHLLTQVKALYDSAPRMLSANREIFSTPWDLRSQQSTPKLKSYHKWASPIVKQSILDAADFGQNFRRIDAYFPALQPVLPQHLRDVIHICP